MTATTYGLNPAKKPRSIIDSAPLFLVMYQMKIITTAVFYSTLLSRRISNKEWLSIIILAIGVSMVQSSQKEFLPHHASNTIGLVSVIFACMTSGLAGVFFEKTIKQSKTSIWMINVQMSLLSCVLSMVRQSLFTHDHPFIPYFTLISSIFFSFFFYSSQYI